MAAPATEDLRELERELTIAAESGATRTFAELREQFGLGHDDLEQALATLREHGKAVEAAPGEWRGPLMDEIGVPDRAVEPARVQVHVGEDEGEPTDAPSEGPDMSRGPITWEALDGAEPTVRLTRAIVEALDASAVGQIVKVAIEQGPDDAPFTLEVLP